MRVGSENDGAGPARPASGVRRRAEAAPQASLVDEQRRAAELVRRAAASVQAPEHLRAWLAAQGDQAGRPSTRPTTRRRAR
jgi:hypothetical protein